MADNVTYILGAGASIKAIPAYDNFKYRFCAFCFLLELLWDNEEQRSYLEHLMVQVNQHYSPDTFAKKLFLSQGGNGVEYRKFKLVLLLYLIYEQSDKDNDYGDINFYFVHPNYKVFRERLKLSDGDATEIFDNLQYLDINIRDERYDVFLASLIDEKTGRLPENINIISWNYDFQLEFAYSTIYQKPYQEILANLRICPNVFDSTRSSSSRVIKLNGTAYYINDNGYKEVIDLVNGPGFNEKTIELFYKNLQSINTNSNEDIASALSFAWENTQMHLTSRQIARQIISATSILVFIGYSFPPFNRWVDRQIFQLLPRSLKRIDCQVKETDFEGVKQRALGILPVLSKMNLISGLDQFYIPPGI